MKKYIFALAIVVAAFMGSGYAFAAADGCCVNKSCACVNSGCCTDGKCACKGDCCAKGVCRCAEGKCDKQCVCAKR